MGFRLKEVVPWGRSFDEYVAMFALSEEDLEGRILGCGDGPASFNAGVFERGGRAASVDPIYELTAEQIRGRIGAACEEVLEQTRRNREEFVWERIRSVEELGRIRLAAMEAFLSDFERGKREGRYLAASLPKLPFVGGAFDLAVCSHFLFVYSEQLTADFHVDSIREMCRVGRETRVFPVLELGARRSRHLGEVITALEAEGYRVGVRKVAYEFQRGGDEMLVVEGERKDEG